MMLMASPHRNQFRRTGFLVMYHGKEAVLCPFFGKCDGLLVIDPIDGRRKFYKGTEHNAETMCDLILNSGVQRLVLGFVPGPEATKLRAAGIDVRLGNCCCTIDNLTAVFDTLPIY